MGGVRRQGEPKKVFKHTGKVLPQKRRAFAKVLRSVKVHFGGVYEAIKEQWRWLRKQDWELIDVEATDETSSFPTLFHPWFVLTWRCNRTGNIRGEEIT
jgi:hypothetical protein